VIPDAIEKGVPDLPTNAFFRLRSLRGHPRVLDLMDKHGIKLSSFMIGKRSKPPRISRRKSCDAVTRRLLTAGYGTIPTSYARRGNEPVRFA